ncbi:hypothetical protein [Streptomyces sp. NPDC093269]|uniref:TRADD-N-associated membrane domain-containing protein n=1 Tax=Streptomyces sp. NPDC093269 TaxID=3366038 RepID=UPI0038097DDA
MSSREEANDTPQSDDGPSKDALASALGKLAAESSAAVMSATGTDAWQGTRERIQRLFANQHVEQVGTISNVFLGDSPQAHAESETRPSLAEKRQDFHFEYLKHSLKQAEWTFRLSVWFMTGGALVILAGAVLALVHAGNPNLSYLPLVTSLTGALITVGGGALALHSKRTMANLTQQAEHNEEKIDLDHKLEAATALIDRVDDPAARDRLNAAAAMKALDIQPGPEVMVDRLLPEAEGLPTREIEPGDSSR